MTTVLKAIKFLFLYAIWWVAMGIIMTVLIRVTAPFFVAFFYALGKALGLQ